MAVNKDIILNSIRKQLALNSGQLQVVNRGGNWQFANGNGTPISATNDATNYGLSQAPARYVAGMQAQTFGGQGVPEELIEVLANLATYYANQTGQPVQNLFKQGILLNDFLYTINSIRDPSSQIGYVGLNLSPNWSNNPTLGPTITAAMGV
jgi:hypothetical protein